MNNKAKDVKVLSNFLFDGKQTIIDRSKIMRILCFMILLTLFSREKESIRVKSNASFVYDEKSGTLHVEQLPCRGMTVMP